MTTKKYLLDTSGQLHIWTHSSYDRIHKTCERHSQTRIERGVGFPNQEQFGNY